MLKRLAFTALVLVFANQAVAQLTKQDIDRAIDKDALEHPYLYFSADDVTEMRALVKTDKESADIMKRRLVMLDRAGLTDYMVLPVHDEVLFDVPDAMVEDAVATVSDVMPEDDEFFSVALDVDVDVLKENWGDKYE